MDDSWRLTIQFFIFWLVNLWVLGFLEIDGPKSKLHFKLYIE
jgi:hypothetical protein